ncbi:hypothetical protein A3D00_02295 [Candidatus Woesebacteria bacterium RIFCSPHIGHO2_02_FULL_38_9]|nr:MAG: hypothetical protein A3D00_02295 [Candidatus Woesebacteria bacterium RIFCSPHIGHO2_02_FULL_38_9]OGM57780.1 MAG: hypothetical protein A3A50_05715 [Candidatus Woesebacteria bacterium RIFCSPLOWO2_01_FULL_38_20]
MAKKLFPCMRTVLGRKLETDDYITFKRYGKEAKGYELIDGIYDELVMADSLIKGKKTGWKRF